MSIHGVIAEEMNVTACRIGSVLRHLSFEPRVDANSSGVELIVMRCLSRNFGEGCNGNGWILS